MADFTMYRGETKTWEITVTDGGVALDITGANIRFVVRDGYPASTVVLDTDALISKSTAALGGITITDGPAGEFELELVKADTTSLTPGAYYYGIETILAGETEPIVIQQGEFEILPDVVRAI